MVSAGNSTPPNFKGGMEMSRKLMGIAIFVWLALLVAGFAPVQPRRGDKYPVADFLFSGPGGGADQIARMISPLMESTKTPFRSPPARPAVTRR
jgi:hypothetical protein